MPTDLTINPGSRSGRRRIRRCKVTWRLGYTWRSSEPDGDPIPAHVEREFRQYLTCGILAHGFARARCAGYGHDFLVAFSCKGRGICPACSTRWSP